MEIREERRRRKGRSHHECRPALVSPSPALIASPPHLPHNRGHEYHVYAHIDLIRMIRAVEGELGTRLSADQGVASVGGVAVRTCALTSNSEALVDMAGWGGSGRWWWGMRTGAGSRMQCTAGYWFALRARGRVRRARRRGHGVRRCRRHRRRHTPHNRRGRAHVGLALRVCLSLPLDIICLLPEVLLRYGQVNNNRARV